MRQAFFVSTLAATLLLFGGKILIDVSHAQSTSQEIRFGHLRFHCPRYLQATDTSAIKVLYSGLTHPGISYPDWLTEFPITEKLYVIFDNDDELHEQIWKDLDLSSLLSRQCKKSLSLVGRLDRDCDSGTLKTLVFQAAKNKLESNEEYFDDELSDEQMAKIDHLFFWKLIRRDGFFTTFAGNRYLKQYLAPRKLELSADQIKEMQSFPSELSPTAIEIENQLLAEYQEIILPTMSDEFKAELNLLEIPVVELVINNLDIVCCDTRDYLNNVESKSQRIRRRYSNHGFSGVNLLPGKDPLVLNPEIEVTLRFLYQLRSAIICKKLIPSDLRKPVVAVVKDMVNQLTVVDSQFAGRGVKEQDFAIRSVKIGAIVEDSLSNIKQILGEENWRSVNSYLQVDLVRQIGLDYLLNNTSEDLRDECAENLKQWLDDVDQSFIEFDRECQTRLTAKLTTNQKSAIDKLLGERPIWILDGFSHARLNLEFKF